MTFEYKGLDEVITKAVGGLKGTIRDDDRDDRRNLQILKFDCYQNVNDTSVRDCPHGW